MHESQTLSENIGPVKKPCWRFLKIGEREEHTFASTTWFWGPIFFGKLSWDCEEVADRTDRQVVKTQNWPNLGTVSFVGRWRVLQVPQVLGCCTVVCCVLCSVWCVLLLQVVLVVVLVGKSRSAGGAPHYFLPSPPSTWSLSSSSSPPCYSI